ncbi:DNA polymerase III subunit delta' [Eubacteriaceae bacterium ES2]|nr:DNA polymerase III subunit delta' [Eubacteriaceae bacterium ES2]
MNRIIGHNLLVEQLKRQVHQDAVSHAYLFTGIAGIGKKKLALDFAKTILCQGQEPPCGHCPVCKQIDHGIYPDLQVISSETSIKIAQVREMISSLAVKPFSGEKRIIIIDDAATMTVEAQNSLLKSLEEPFFYNLFILLTQTPEGVLPTIRSRCQIYHFKPLKQVEVAEILKRETEFSETEIADVISPAAGSVEKALYLLNQPDILQDRVSILRELYLLLKGDLQKIFTLSERLSSDKSKSQEMLEFLIRWFYEITLCKKGLALPDGQAPGKVHEAFQQILKDEKIEAINRTLFEMMDRMKYNINLNLQWEKTFIQIIKIQKG